MSDTKAVWHKKRAEVYGNYAGSMLDPDDAYLWARMAGHFGRLALWYAEAESAWWLDRSDYER